jgi:hypothetical protein
MSPFYPCANEKLIKKKKQIKIEKIEFSFFFLLLLSNSGRCMIRCMFSLLFVKKKENLTNVASYAKIIMKCINNFRFSSLLFLLFTLILLFFFYNILFIRCSIDFIVYIKLSIIYIIIGDSQQRLRLIDHRYTPLYTPPRHFYFFRFCLIELHNELP